MNPKAHPIFLDKERSMFFPNTILKQLLEKFGSMKELIASLEIIGRDGGQQFNAEDLTKFLDLMAYGFLHESPEMTGAKLYEITSIGDLPILGTIFGRAVAGSLPVAKEGSGNPKKGQR